MNKTTSVEIELDGKILTLSTGQLAVQATSSVLATLGETVVLVTVVEGGKTELDYFPLSLDYVERLYAGGKIKGSRWVKREGRPSDEAILAGRVIDRSIRPLFPKAFKNEVQIIVTVLSVDSENSADIVALNAVSAALAISRIPWNGPIGGIRMGYVKEKDGTKAEFLANPTISEVTQSELDIIVSQTADGKTVMVEAGALQASEDVVYTAIEKAQAETKKIIAGINELVKKVGQKKLELEADTVVEDAIKLVEKAYIADIEALIASRVDKEAGGNDMDALTSKIVEDSKDKTGTAALDKKTVVKAIEYIMFKLIRAAVITKKKRVDGRKFDEIRQISTQVGLLPRVHGSALFQRGITQALSVVTLGSPRMEQLIESAEGEVSKRYIHHYSGLPYSFGQTGRVGTPSRREIGHGALAERALQGVIPSQKDFPYTIRVVSEVLSQNGSSSMASTCGSTLALMDAGVPILKPVAGISIGMMSDGDKYELLTDIIGLEDFSGDMDFKVAGTDSGITAIQLDVKVPGLTLEQIKNILERAKTARMQILEIMLATIPAHKPNLSKYAPKIETVQIPVDKIGELIGPGGKNIKNIIATTGAQVDVEDDGTVTISGIDTEAVQKAVDWITGLTREVTVGESFEGEVKRILPFGAFVEFLPGKEGMVHVSKMSTEYVGSPEEVVQIGQKVKVRVVEVDDQGRINLSMLFGEDAGAKDKERSDRPRSDRPYQSRGPRNFTPRPGGSRPYDSRPPRDFNRRVSGPNDINSAGPSDHPLAQQFRRERRGSFGAKPGYSRKPTYDKKPTY